MTPTHGSSECLRPSAIFVRLVGLGASAGGLEPFELLLSSVPAAAGDFAAACHRPAATTPLQPRWTPILALLHEHVDTTVAKEREFRLRKA